MKARSPFPKIQLRSLAVTSLLCLAAAPSASADDYSWNGASGATWSTGPWVDVTTSGSGTPGSSDNIVTPTAFNKMDVNGSRTVTNFTFNSTSLWEMYEATTNGTLTISGTLTKSGSGTLIFRNSSKTLDLSVGAVSLSGGTLDFGNTSLGSAQNPIDALTLGSATVSGTGTLLNFRVGTVTTGIATITGDLTLSDASTIVIRPATGPGESGTLSVGALKSISSVGTPTLEGTSTSTTPVTSSLIITGASGTATYGGLIIDDTHTAAGATLSLSKTGGNTQVLTNANTYSGGTTLSGGSATGVNKVTINSGGTLGGSGTVKPTAGTGVTVNTGGILASGDAQSGAAVDGTHLTLDNSAGLAAILTVNSGSKLAFALGTGGTSNPNAYTSPNLNSTYLKITDKTGGTPGELAFSGSVTFNIIDLTTDHSLLLSSSTPYLLLQAARDSDYSGIVTTGGLDQDGLVLGIGTVLSYTPVNLTLTDSSGTPLGDIYGPMELYLSNGNLEVDAVPEPSTWALLLASLGLLVTLRPRRKSVPFLPRS